MKLNLLIHAAGLRFASSSAVQRNVTGHFFMELLPKSISLNGGVETTPPPSLVCGVGIVLNPDNFLSETAPYRIDISYFRIRPIMFTRFS